MGECGTSIVLPLLWTFNGSAVRFPFYSILDRGAETLQPIRRVVVSSIVQIAVAAGLHLDVQDARLVRPTIGLPPASQAEAQERRMLWHAIHMSDLTVASVCGLSFQVPANVSRDLTSLCFWANDVFRISRHSIVSHIWSQCVCSSSATTYH